jgi:hypothetical protein
VEELICSWKTEAKRGFKEVLLCIKYQTPNKEIKAKRSKRKKDIKGRYTKRKKKEGKEKTHQDGSETVKTGSLSKL